MKRNILLFFTFFFFLSTSNAQQTQRLLMEILDTNFIPVNQSNPFLFQNNTIGSTFNTMGLSSFRKAFPNTNYLFLKNLYELEVNNSNPMIGNYIQSIYPSAFRFRGNIKNGNTLCYHPNDYSKSTVFDTHQYELDYIRADTAWCYNRGDDAIIGMTDNYVYTSQIDLQNKRVSFPGSQNNIDMSYIDRSHGTGVAGILAGHTNNDTLLASIGYNAKFSSDTRRTYLGIEHLINSGLRIVNNSWILDYHYIDYCQDPASIDVYKVAFNAPGAIIDQLVYNDFYEQGAVCVFSAGNGDGNVSGSICHRDSAMFPASFNHNISVTTVGHLRPAMGSNYYDCIADKHQYNNGESHNHNKYIDIVAPGHFVPMLDSILFIPNNVQIQQPRGGTSVSAPFVSGTIGLMLSANPALSPYQVEWLLKKTANDSPYLHPANAALVADKQLGAGRLDAGQTVKHTKNIYIYYS